MGFPAFAQKPPADNTVEQIKPPQDEGKTSPKAEVVIITGTRLQSQFSSSSPMEIIDSKEADSKGISDLASLLRNSTVAAGAPQITSITSTAFSSVNGIQQIGGQGAESISLRGLGANRTLVLLDGKRAGPAGTQGTIAAFDLNVLPLSAISRIDILKDGASTIYGSDAIAGVVNIITKKDDGGTIDAFYSQPQHGGGEQERFTGSYGATFGNLTFRVTGDYYKQGELARRDRSYLDCGAPYIFNANGSRADLIDPRTGTYGCSADLPVGQIWIYDSSGADPTVPGSGLPWNGSPGFLQYGNLGKYIPHLGANDAGIVTPANLFPVGYNNRVGDPAFAGSQVASEQVYDYHSPYQDGQSLQPEVERMTIFANGSYDFNDHIQAYTNVLLNRRTTKIHSYTQFWTFQYLYEDGGDPQATADGLACTFCILNPTAATDHAGGTVQVDYARALIGAKGDFDFTPWKGWTWDISTQFSHSCGYYKNEIIFDDAISPYEPSGHGGDDQTCATMPLTRDRGAPCLTLDWYSPRVLNGQLTKQERAFLFGVDVGRTSYDQISTEGYVSGQLPFKLPAGKIGVVLGGAYEDDKILDTPDPLFQNGGVWTGAPGGSSAGVTKGSDYTRALFGEVSLPLLRDMPFAKSLEVTGSARYTYVGSYGGQSTWKYGLNREINDWLRVRGSRGTSFRSPALHELYLADLVSSASQRADPCINWGAALTNGTINQRVADNCAADGIPNNHSGAGVTESVISRGGKGFLKAETSDAKSFGFIFSPTDTNFQLSVDYFDIGVDNEVSQLGVTNILFTCYNSTNHATDPTCRLFTRIPAGAAGAFNLLTVLNDYINIASQRQRGVDVQALWKVELGAGQLNIQAEASHSLEQTQTLLPGSPAKESVGLIGFPKWVGNVDTTYQLGKWSFFYGLRYVGGTNNLSDFGVNNPQTYYGQPVNFVLRTRPYVYTDVSVAYELPWKSNIRIGISNLTDKKPPLVSAWAGEYGTVGDVPLDGSNYDFFGRTFFVNVTKVF